MKFYFGIDFGTTNSACTGFIDGKKMVKIHDQYDGSPFPSLVIIDPATGQVYCGREAWFKRQEYSEHCEVITSVKTYLGTDKTWYIAGKIWTPEMVAAEIFRGLRNQMTATVGKTTEINEAVVAVPVGFASNKRADLRRAAKRAGLEIKTFVSEPTAAFVRHIDEIGGYNRVGVLDWGGGTLDVSILENNKRLIKELATGGEYLGGDNIDLKVALWAHNQIINKNKVSISFDEMTPVAKDMLIARAERAKKDLAVRDVVDIVLNKYGELGPCRVSLDIATFSSIIENEIERAINCFEETLRRARISMKELGCILMVGGSVNLRPFINKVEDRWDCLKVYSEDSDWSVARGVATLSINPGQYQLAETIGVIMADDSFYPLIKEGSAVDHIPSSFSFALVEDSNTANIIFSDGNRRILGFMHVPSFGFFKEKINIQSFIDKDLVLKVEARSQHRSERYIEEWNYPGPRLLFKLPRD